MNACQTAWAEDLTTLAWGPLQPEDADWLRAADAATLDAVLEGHDDDTVEAILEQIETMPSPKERAEMRLADFVRQAWHVVEPETEYVHNWHIDVICDHLEQMATADGEIKNLVVNIPPGCMKSLLMAVFFPAWVWIKNPSTRILCASYAQSLSVRDSIKCRQIVKSHWYRENWPHVRLSSDQDVKTRFDTTARGWRYATSVGGGVTGEHPDIVIVDDAIKADDATSQAERDSVCEWWDSAVSTRGRSRGVRRIISGQRVHENDLPGHVLASGVGWVHLMLPMEYENERRCETAWGGDRRTTEAELLWPDLFDYGTVREIELELRPHRAAGQLQQRPTNKAGDFFREEWFSKRVDVAPDGLRVVRFWDKAGSDESGAFTSGVAIGRKEGTFYVLDVKRGQWSLGRRERIIKETAHEDKRNYKDLRIRLEQEPGSGGKDSAMITVRNLAGFRVRAEPATGKKTSRAEALASQAEAGNVILVRGDWNAAFVKELTEFPNGNYLDQVDAASGAFNVLALDKTGISSQLTGKDMEAIADVNDDFMDSFMDDFADLFDDL